MKSLALILTCAALLAVGCSDKEDATPAGACGDSPLTGKHLWQIGNCEVGTVTPVSATSCDVTLCGANAREASECAGDKLFDVTVSGTTLSGGESPEPMELTRHIDCATASVDAETCAFWQCLIDSDPDVYVARYTGRDASEQFYPDGLWVVMDKAWPATNACREDADVMERYAQVFADCE